VSGIAGPKQSRLTRTTKPLFKGYKIHAAPPFVSTSQKEIEVNFHFPICSLVYRGVAERCPFARGQSGEVAGEPPG
jgi:hypothetical protein